MFRKKVLQNTQAFPVNQFNIKDNLLSLKGQSTSSNLTHKRLSHTMGEQIFISETYGSGGSMGGTSTSI